MSVHVAPGPGGGGSGADDAAVKRIALPTPVAELPAGAAADARRAAARAPEPPATARSRFGVEGVRADAAVNPARGFCLNCDNELVGPFCARCGQRATRYSVSLAVLAKEFADEYLSFDSRLFRTVLNLFFRPGFLTRQYVIGRHVRYVRPLRLYIVASLLFFLVFSLKGGFQVDPELPEAFSPAAAQQAATDAPAADRGAGPEGDAPGDAAGDGAGDGAAGPAQGDTWPGLESIQGRVRIMGMEVDAQERAQRLASLGPQGMVDAFFAGFERYLPRLMFLLLPLFALLLKLLYVRRRWFYAEHFIFALHIHAFFFSLFLLLLVLPDGFRPVGLLMLWGALYLFLAMRQVYRQGWIKTAIKYSMLTGVYSVAVGLTFVGLVVATVLLV